MKDSGAAGCTIVCFSVLILALAIPSLIIGIQGRNDDCLETDPIGINISQWLIGSGIADIGLLVIVSTFGCIALCGAATECECTQCFGAFGMYAFPITWVIFKLIYLIIGIVILARSSGECVKSGSNLGVMAIIDFVLFLF
jgi:hypothetical protein